VAFAELSQVKPGEDSETIRKRVIQAREVQARRFEQEQGIYANAQMSNKSLKEICILDPLCQQLLKIAMDKLNLSARAYDRILRVSRTIADLEGTELILPEHIAEAIQYRSLDRESWGG
jgi:magnesium chelatase family protein